MPSLKKSLNGMNKALGEMRAILAQAKEQYGIAKRLGELTPAEDQEYQILIENIEREIANMTAMTNRDHQVYQQLRPGIELLRLSKQHFVAIVIYLSISTGCCIGLSCAKEQNPKIKNILATSSVLTVMFGLFHINKWVNYRTKAQDFFRENDNQR